MDRVAEIRAESEAARSRIAGTLEALRFKTDLPARLGESMGNAAATFAAHVMDRVTSAESDGALGEDATVLRVGSESDGSQDEGEP